MGRIGLPELIVILVIILLLFGAKKLPDIARSLRNALDEFHKAGKKESDSEPIRPEDEQENLKS